MIYITESFKIFREYWNKKRKGEEVNINKMSLDIRVGTSAIKNYLIDMETIGKVNIKRDLIRGRIIKIVKKGNLK